MAFVTPTYKNVSSFTQYGSVMSSSGTSGNVVVSLPISYTTSNSYVVQATHGGSNAGARHSVVRSSPNSFIIYWTGGGNSVQPFDWLTIGS
jgi:hypothetical protein